MSIPEVNPWLIPGFAPVTPGQGGTRVFAPGVGGAPQAAPPPKGSPIIFPWWQLEMPGSSDWELNALNFTAAANATTLVPLFSFRVSAGNVGILAFLQFTVQNPLAGMDLRARILVNGAPVQGWSQLALPPLAASAFVQTFNSLVIRMTENQTLTAQVIEARGTNYTCSLQARGWTTPTNIVSSFMSGVPY